VEKLIVLLAMHSLADSGGIEIPRISQGRLYEEGVASWYGSGVKNDGGLHGRITATGEVFNPDLKTAASRSIPLNTTVLIEIPRTGAKAWCRVNDRGPYGAMNEGEWIVKLTKEDPGSWRGVMDLSKGCASELEFNFNQGFEQIKIYTWR